MNKNIRNLAIIAHIDHGKSTLSDRIMESTNTVPNRDMKNQLLDDLQVEKDHGVTVKARAVQSIYLADDKQKYEINLIDTPGHMDFQDEVKRSLMASENAILLIDATQGIEAQTLATLKIAQKIGLKILPVINKIDIEGINVSGLESEIKRLLPEYQEQYILKISAKTGQGIHELLEAITTDFLPPVGNENKALSALVFDSYYDSYKGVILYVRIIDGILRNNQKLLLLGSRQKFKTHQIGIFKPKRESLLQLKAGEVGYLITGIKKSDGLYVGDTVTECDNPTSSAVATIEGSPVTVFAGIYPLGDYKMLALALKQLKMNDSSLIVKDEYSQALGTGFRLGLLGLFHLQIIKERLKKEFLIDVLVTHPNVPYRVHLKNTETVVIDNPSNFPDFDQVDYVEELMLKATIVTPKETLNDVMNLLSENRGNFLQMDNHNKLVDLSYKIPLSKTVYSFLNKLKSTSHGYASLTTSSLGYYHADVVRIDIHVNYVKVEELTFIDYKSESNTKAQKLVHQLKYAIPRQLYPLPVQAVVEGKVIARVDVPPLRKNAAVSGKKKSVSKQQELLRRQNVNKRKATENAIKLPQKVFNVMLEIED